mmetsp:Transcript_6079/g.6988  ORF Transcript_6079/g.6988 Transcript_6079/m.6988 type:complete len:445 (+) Transcript_6079:408-1742(+)|eukprot:CAMPEP_0184028860 /NCGR_PEP_ID=MMETSP0954-20121128/15093_1 /TAXON_ID=627963 /ORGANISM="Aplanochytrium sp, Strain PBS07" /LENGTH=444 /DNA_ID=CAMNT_0026313787 /DNA_START=363 /DNA_END=1697 /DNA_ORIENTATION=+
MGQCLGSSHSREVTLNTKANSGDPVPPKSPPPKTAVNVEDDDDLYEQYQLTKGSSMFLPGDDQDLDADMQDLDNALKDIEAEMDEEDDFDHPVYSSSGETYQVGDAVVYAPDMEKSIAFDLTDDEGGKTSTLTFGYKTLAGKTGGGLYGKANQDSLCVVRTKDRPNQAIFSVFDGHGPNGEHASHYCRMNFKRNYVVQKSKYPDATPEELMERTLAKLDRGFGATDPDATNVDPIVSGTTAVSIFFDGKNIISANVGDSRAIMGTKVNGVVEAFPLTDDHKPNRPSEMSRIKQTSAKVLTERELRGMTPKDDPDQKVYVCRQRRGEIIYAVLFSRSLGDVDAHRNLGVISDPEFERAVIDDSKEQCVIIASDGIWDMMSNQEVADLVFKIGDPLKASEEIVSIAATRWADSEERRRDDITVTVVGIGEAFAQQNGLRREGSFLM